MAWPVSSRYEAASAPLRGPVHQPAAATVGQISAGCVQLQLHRVTSDAARDGTYAGGAGWSLVQAAVGRAKGLSSVRALMRRPDDVTVGVYR